MSENIDHGHPQESSAPSHGAEQERKNHGQPSIQEFRDWQSTNHQPSTAAIQFASSSDIIENYRKFLDSRRSKPSEGAKKVEGVLDLYELMTMLSVELQLLIFQHLNEEDFVMLKRCCKSVNDLLNLLGPGLAATRPNVARFKRYLDEFNYKEMAFDEALHHWNSKKGIVWQAKGVKDSAYTLADVSRTDEDLNDIQFARYYIWRNSNVDPASIRQNSECVSQCAKLAHALTYLHLATHTPHLGTDPVLDREYWHLYAPESYEAQILKLPVPDANIKIDKQEAIRKVKEDEYYLGGQSGVIWLLNRMFTFEPDGGSSVTTQSRQAWLIPVEQYLRATIMGLDKRLNLVPRRLGLPLLPWPFERPSVFVYRCPEGGGLMQQLVHKLGLASTGIAELYPDLTWLEKIYVIDNSSIY